MPRGWLEEDKGQYDSDLFDFFYQSGASFLMRKNINVLNLLGLLPLITTNTYCLVNVYGKNCANSLFLI